MSENKNPRLILASASPRRTELLNLIGVEHSVLPADVDESHDVPSEPGEHVSVLAERKALAIAVNHPEALVLGSDTIVYHDGDILGKPRDFEHAVELVSRLAGNFHQVFSGVALAGPSGREVASSFEVTRVKFRELGKEEIRRYVATEEPLDKAGAYGIQGYGATLVEKVDGCYFNVMGLPLVRLVSMLASRGICYPFGPLQWS
jgi:nucleoside triphosphate pyrophosphatase